MIAVAVLVAVLVLVAAVVVVAVVAMEACAWLRVDTRWPTANDIYEKSPTYRQKQLFR